MQINKTQFISPNFSERDDSVDMIVIHSTHMKKYDSLHRLCDRESQVSCHYVVGLDGDVYGLVEEGKVAYHAGASYWRGREKLNRYSIGIELVDVDVDNKRVKNFTEQQMQSLLKIMKDMMSRYKIPSYNIVAHSDIAPDRKDDPGEIFDWQRLSDHGIGVFPNKHTQDVSGFLIKKGDKGNDVLMVQRLLHQYGYKITVDGVYNKQTEDVIIAFKRHFDDRNISDVFDEVSLAVLKEIIQYSSTQD
ncbi:MAG: N-acetylmuramoyl-L-alanine amidase [Alphaproteobacteria bacterium]|nr:N-acetylmuramoyl-L-alanine amidase [Alphaproteobacteria bacterium]